MSVTELRAKDPAGGLKFLPELLSVVFATHALSHQGRCLGACSGLAGIWSQRRAATPATGSQPTVPSLPGPSRPTGSICRCDFSQRSMPPLQSRWSPSLAWELSRCAAHTVLPSGVCTHGWSPWRAAHRAASHSGIASSCVSAAAVPRVPL